MSKKIFVRAEEGEPPGISVVYYDTDGNKTIRYHVESLAYARRATPKNPEAKNFGVGFQGSVLGRIKTLK